MAKQKRPKAQTDVKSRKRPIEQYDHKDKTRVNNPPVGLVTPQTDPPVTSRKTYEYDPHLDPQLVWAGKKEHTSFEIPTVSLHVHERIDPRTIIEAVRKRNGVPLKPAQGYLFETREENPPLREAVDFYRHPHGWTNRLIAGDSLLVMNSLLEKEGMAGQVQMVYIDPPYGIRYGSNFQPFVNRRDVKDGKDEDLTQEPEMVRAFRDTWELGIHSYLTYLRDRLLLARELLHESGSCFVQISDENVHYVRALMNEVFDKKNFCGLIAFRTTGGQSSLLLASSTDYLVWFAKDRELAARRFRQPTQTKEGGFGGTGQYTLVEPRDGSGEPRQMTKVELRDPESISPTLRILAHDTLYSQGAPSDPADRIFEFRGKKYQCPPNTHWKTSVKNGGMDRLARANRILVLSETLRYKRYLEDYPVSELDNVWEDTGTSGFARKKQFVVETNPKVIERCILMTTDPGDLVFDPTCGSGTTAFVAEQWGRRWITCDTSRVATTLAKQRFMGATFDYYKLAHPDEGVGSGFEYKKVPHVTLKSIANNEPPGEETLYDQPLVDNSRARISGPFTVEAVPAPNVKSIDDLPVVCHPERSEGSAFSSSHSSATPPQPADASIARSGSTLRQSDWRDELLKTGLRGKGGQMINFSRVEPLGGTRWLHADAETKGTNPERVVISFGPDYAPLEQRQVELAWEEARTLHPKPEILVFAAFQFDPEAAKDIDDLTREKSGMTFLTAQMNADLLTDDLKKKRSSNQSFWLVGRPDVDLRQIKSGDGKGKYQAEVRGFDYYNTRTGAIESGDTAKIAMWLLDTDYDGRSLYPRQVFFPLADEDEGWAKLARNLKAEIDPELIEAYRGTVSLPFAPGEHKRIAVKVIDDRGIESLKVLQL
ncbi:MAG: site-specific DNA-methyltransferase [Acidobacteriia bacterium]|nr:site-specific DNA-methyltransferase [Terriglobia bacterium]